MKKNDMKDVSKLNDWMCRTNVSFGVIKSFERVRMGDLSGYHYRSRINTTLAASHVLSDVTLYQKDQVCTFL